MDTSNIINVVYNFVSIFLRQYQLVCRTYGSLAWLPRWEVNVNDKEPHDYKNMKAFYVLCRRPQR
jgi:hypothetical protein